jgi:hypothetical protein
MENNIEAQVRAGLEEMKEIMEQAINDIDVLLNKKYVKKRAIKLRHKLDYIGKEKVELKKLMFQFEKEEKRKK